MSPVLAWLFAAVLFALGHYLVTFHPASLLVFFPGLLFGILRGWSGSVLAGTLFHATCNLVMESSTVPSAKCGLWRVSRYDLRVAQRQAPESYFIIRFDDAERIVRMWRTSEPFPTCQRSHGLAVGDRCLQIKIGRSGRCLLSDLRAGPARNDPEFEKIVTALIRLCTLGFCATPSWRRWRSERSRSNATPKRRSRAAHHQQ